MAALRSGDPAAVGPLLNNDLQPAALSLQPLLRRALAAGREHGALGAIVSGSGPTCAFLAAGAGRPATSRSPDRRRRLPRGGRVHRPGSGRLRGGAGRPGVNLVNLEAAAKAYGTRVLLTTYRSASRPATGSASSAATARARPRCSPRWPARPTLGSGRATRAAGCAIGYLPQSRAARRHGPRDRCSATLPEHDWAADAAERADLARAARRHRAGRPARAAFRRRAPAGGAGRGLLRGSTTCSCSTSRPTTWTSRRSAGWPATWRAHAAALVVVTHDRWFLDAVCQRPGRSPTARSTPTRAATRPTCWPGRSGPGRPRRRTSAGATCSARSWPGCGAGRRPGPASRSSGSKRPPR